MTWNFYNAAGFLKTSTGRELVSTLPSAPVDGQEVFYQTASMATDGIAWHLRYRSGSASTYKWELVGGLPWQSTVTAGQSNSGTSNATWSVMPTTQVNRTAPLAGEYLVTFGAGTGFTTSAGSSAYLNFSINNSTPALNDSVIFETPAGETANIANAGSISRVATVSTAGHVIDLKFYAGSAATWTWRAYYLSIVPIRVTG